MALTTDNDKDLTIGVNIDASELPAQAQRAESTVRKAVESTTRSVQEQGQAAKQTGQEHEESATKAEEAWQKTGKKGKEAGKDMGEGFGSASSLVEMLNTKLSRTTMVLEMVGKATAIMAAISTVIAGVKALVDYCSKLGAAAETAGTKFMRLRQAQMDEARVAKAREAELRFLASKQAAHDKLVKTIQQEATLAARMREIEARQAGNQDQVEQARLDIALIQNRITEAEHLLATREIEDRGRKRDQENEMATARDKWDVANQGLAAASHGRQDADAELQNYMKKLRSWGLVDKQGQETGALGREYQRWANANERLEAGDYWDAADKRKMQFEAEMTSAAGRIRAAAKALNVALTKDGEDRKLDEVVREVEEALRKGVETRKKALSDAVARIEAGKVALATAGWEVDELTRRHDSDNSVVAAGRAREDARRTEEAHKAAMAAAEAEQQARADAARAEAEEARRQAQDTLARRLLQADTKKSRYQDALGLAGERATETQRPAMDALRKLLEKGRKTPQVLDWVETLMRGRSISLDRDSMRRFGADLGKIKQGDLRTEQRREVVEVIRLFREVLKAEGRVQTAEAAVNKLDKQEQRAARETRQDNVLRASQEAEAAGQRSWEASERLRASEAQMRKSSEQMGAATDAAVQSADGAAGFLSVMVEQASRMAAASERQAADSRQAMLKLKGLADRMDRLENQTRFNLQ